MRLYVNGVGGSAESFSGTTGTNILTILGRTSFYFSQIDLAQWIGCSGAWTGAQHDALLSYWYAKYGLSGSLP